MLLRSEDHLTTILSTCWLDILIAQRWSSTNTFCSQVLVEDQDLHVVHMAWVSAEGLHIHVDKCTLIITVDVDPLKITLNLITGFHPWLPCTLNVTLVDKDSVAIVHSHCHTSGHGVATTFKLTLEELHFEISTSAGPRGSVTIHASTLMIETPSGSPTLLYVGIPPELTEFKAVSIPTIDLCTLLTLRWNDCRRWVIGTTRGTIANDRILVASRSQQAMRCITYETLSKSKAASVNTVGGIKDLFQEIVCCT